MLWLLLAASLSVGAKGTKSDPLLIQTTQGLIQGHYTTAGIREWKGIPYAQPPVGALRWEYPLPAKELSNGQVYEANFDAMGCSQICNLPPGNCPVYGVGEDCLYLTVYSPATPSHDPQGYPVHFWIHGGAFEQGLGNCALYNGTQFALQNITSVVINYRLGAFGFLASESMKGNYGFLDQRLALQWTIANIAGFGGNPNKITIAGQSAGGMSVGAHMISPNSKGLFQGAIMESNPIGLPFHTRESAQANADDIFTYLGCAVDDVACMRTKTMDEILDAQTHAIKLDFDTLLLNFLPFAPMTEAGGEIPEQPLIALADAKQIATPSPLLAGTTYDEGQLFVFELFTKPVTDRQYKLIIEAVFGVEAATRILHKYPFDLIENNTDGRAILNILATDLLFHCPLRNVTVGYQATAKAAGIAVQPTYMYRFKHIESFDCWGPGYEFCVGYVCHGSELPFVFNVFTDGVNITYYPTAEEKTLTVDMSNAWTNFFRSGSPNVGLPIPRKYPVYESDSDILIILDEPVPENSYETHTRASYCALWDSLGYFW